MTSNKILDLYNEISGLEPISLQDLIEARLDLLLTKYEADLQMNFETLQKYNYLEIIKEVNKNARFG